MKTNDVKKGTRVRLRNGWFGTMADNAKGQTRMVDVEGHFREIGSVYSHDIVAALIGETWTPIEHTPAQNKLKASVAACGF
jgi:hypothetical protein